MPLELFFDLVFVLALTQCTALMARDPTWAHLAEGLLILGLMWWSWVGYAWLTSVVDPEEGAVRFAIFAAMAGLLIVSLCIPDAFGDRALLFAGAYVTIQVGRTAFLSFVAGTPGSLERRRARPKSNCASDSGIPVSRDMRSRYPGVRLRTSAR